MTRAALIVAVAAMLAAPVTVDAQRGGGGRGGNGGRGGGAAGRGHVATPQPSQPVLGDLGSINRPFGADINGIQTTPPPGFGPPPPSPFAARPGTYTRLHPIPLSLGTPFGYGYAPSYDGASTYEKLYQVRQPEVTTGTLFLDVSPATASVFVDTAYVGSVSDVQARGVMLSAGRHVVDLDAAGYDRKSIEILVNAGEPLRYRYEMTATQRAAAAPVLPPRPPQTMYVIPGCYGGNRPPTAANLPKGCSASQVRVVRPQPRTN
jgi:hypothetical protein